MQEKKGITILCVGSNIDFSKFHFVNSGLELLSKQNIGEALATIKEVPHIDLVIYEAQSDKKEIVSNYKELKHAANNEKLSCVVIVDKFNSIDYKAAFHHGINDYFVLGSFSTQQLLKRVVSLIYQSKGYPNIDECELLASMIKISYVKRLSISLCFAILDLDHSCYTNCYDLH